MIKKRVFISYRRKTWGFTRSVADDLRDRLDADIFVDIDGVDQADFERAIMGHLRSSQVVALIVSEYTFTDRIHRDDDWVRRELVEALKLGIPIVLISVDGQLPPSGLPADIQDIARSQAVNFYPDYFVPACERLASFLGKVGDIPLKRTSSTAAHTFSSTASPAQPTPHTTLEEAIRLLDSDEIEKLEKAVFLLEEVQKTGIKSRINIPAILDKTREEIAATKRQQDAAAMLDEIRLLASSKRTLDEARRLCMQFSATFPDVPIDADLNEKLRPITTLRLGIITSPAPRILRLGDTRTDPKGVPQVYVPAGHFLMGSDPKRDHEARDNEQPQHEVRITQGFWLDQYPVTNAYFKDFTDDNSYQEDRWWSSEGLKWRRAEKVTAPIDYTGFIEDSKQPRVGLHWFEAEAYANWRGGRLPTEAEWEYAAREEQSLIYPWGNDYDQQRLNSEQRIGKTTPVDAYPDGKSWCGAFDLSGNVWEWCADWWDVNFYAQCVKDKLIDNPFCTKTLRYRVLRGGSWHDDPLYCRAAFRDSDLGRGSVIGCRVVAVATPVS